MKLYDLISGSAAADVRTEYSAGDLLYLGIFPEHNDDNVEGIIIKFTWLSDDFVRAEKLPGTWTNRGSLGWA